MCGSVCLCVCSLAGGRGTQGPRGGGWTEGVSIFRCGGDGPMQFIPLPPSLPPPTLHLPPPSSAGSGRLWKERACWESGFEARELAISHSLRKQGRDQQGGRKPPHLPDCWAPSCAPSLRGCPKALQSRIWARGCRGSGRAWLRGAESWRAPKRPLAPGWLACPLARMEGWNSGWSSFSSRFQPHSHPPPEPEPVLSSRAGGPGYSLDLMRQEGGKEGRAGCGKPNFLIVYSYSGLRGWGAPVPLSPACWGPPNCLRSWFLILVDLMTHPEILCNISMTFRGELESIWRVKMWPAGGKNVFHSVYYVII